MPVYVALLRAVNVAGNNLIAMSALKRLAEDLGFDSPRTLLQSGNLVFTTAARSPAKLERSLEEATEKRLGVRTDFLVRSADAWSALVAANPFTDEASSDPAHLLVMPLKEAPKPGTLDALRAAIVGRERVELSGTTAYLVYPDGMGRSKLTTRLIETKLGARGTARNWNTALKLQALLAA